MLPGDSPSAPGACRGGRGLPLGPQAFISSRPLTTSMTALHIPAPLSAWRHARAHTHVHTPSHSHVSVQGTRSGGSRLRVTSSHAPSVHHPPLPGPTSSRPLSLIPPSSAASLSLCSGARGLRLGQDLPAQPADLPHPQAGLQPPHGPAPPLVTCSLRFVLLSALSAFESSFLYPLAVFPLRKPSSGGRERRPAPSPCIFSFRDVHERRGAPDQNPEAAR